MADHTIQQFHHLLEDLESSIKNFNNATNKVLHELSNVHAKCMAVREFSREWHVTKADYEF